MSSVLNQRFAPMATRYRAVPPCVGEQARSAKGGANSGANSTHPPPTLRVGLAHTGGGRRASRNGLPSNPLQHTIEGIVDIVVSKSQYPPPILAQPSIASLVVSD